MDGQKLELVDKELTVLQLSAACVYNLALTHSLFTQF